MVGDVGRIDTDYEFQKIARERLLWVFKPVLAVIIIVWILHPGTSALAHVERNTLLGFLFGAVYGLIVHREELYYHLVTRRKETRERKNRVPDEYYFGQVKEILQAGDTK